MSPATIHIVESPESWIEQAAVDQLHQTARLTGIDRVVGLPDLQTGRGIAVGAAFWSRSHVYPHLVGSDIGCGMALWRTAMPLRKFRLDAAERKLRGLEGAWAGDRAARLAEAGLPPDLAGEALGTIGGGNHFAELLRVETFHEDRDLVPTMLYLVVHSGSRGLGQAILDRHLALYNVTGLIAGEVVCERYLAAHDDAMGWAVLNRALIAERFLDRLGTTGERMLDICHNSVTSHRGGWLHRKGAAPADRGLAVIPGSRGDMTYLVRPRLERADEALHSIAHGAGRKWSRSEARDKLVRRFSIADLERTRLGGRVICEDRDLIYEEAPQAYKDIHQVVRDLEQAELIDPVATLRPLVTYRRVHALLRRQAQQTGRAAPNPKRVYRVMKMHGLLLQRDGEQREERRHDGRVAVDQRNTRWCSDGLEIACDNGEKVRVAFALDCCDREAMGHVATTAGITAQDVQDLMVASVEHRFGSVNRLPEPVEWLTDNGSCYTARDTRAFARDIGLVPRTTPVSSPQSNGMAEAFVRTIKRDYVRVSPRPDARTVIEQLPRWLAHYNDVHPHRALGYRSPREYIAQTREAPSGL